MTFYLLTEGVASPEDAFRTGSLSPAPPSALSALIEEFAVVPDDPVPDDAGSDAEGGEDAGLPYREVTLDPALDGVRVFVQLDKPSEPSWVQYMADHLGPEARRLVRNRTQSVVVLVQVPGAMENAQSHDEIDDGRDRARENQRRWLAAVAGTGTFALKPEVLVGDFGRRATLNSTPEERLVGLSARTLASTTRQRRGTINRPSRVADFGLDVDHEYVDWVKGVPDGVQTVRHMQGSRSLSAVVGSPFEDIKIVCDELVERYNDRVFLDRFSFADRIQTVGKHHPQLQALNDLLATSVLDPQNTEWTAAFPISKESIAAEFDLIVDRRKERIVEVSAGEIRRALVTLGVDLNRIGKVRLRARNDTGQQVHDRSVLEHVVWEVDHGGVRYVCSMGQWVELSRSYVDQVNEDIRVVADRCRFTGGYLPAFGNGVAWNEDVYLNRIGTDENLCTFHGDDKRWRQGRSQVEVCDLFHRDGHFVHVKRGTDADNMSHLFSQGAVSARTFLQHLEFRQHTGGIIEAAGKFPVPFDPANDGRGYTVVFGIACEVGREMPMELPFFSKVNLLLREQEIRFLGFDVQIATIAVG
ncbi:MAG TPA: DUF6119 family protein [Longimicrobiaceae bacterium]|nr:DUF6119 family protein [Longimicrobiaceae bacterium]